MLKLEDKIRELERVKAKFKNIIERIECAVIIVDREGVVQFANNSSQGFLGAPPEDLIGEDFEFPLEVDQKKKIEVKGKGKSKEMAEMRVIGTEWEGDGAYLVLMHNLIDEKK